MDFGLLPRVLLLALLASCGKSSAPYNLPGPAPGPDHQEAVRAKVQELLDGNPKLDGTATAFRFAPPKEDRVARWHFEPQSSEPHKLGYFHGWRVDYWYTPEYEGYPEQPERHEMAFFGEGQLRGIFGEGAQNAPLELDKWEASWADRTWQPVPLPRN
jgi:hypothetical protein